MSSDKISNNDVTEKIKILATDDEKIKSFGEIFTNDSSREILQLLFNEELSAMQLAQKTNVSLQLVKYHLNKLQVLGVVKISKIEKNSKSQDMKIYSATKFSIVIVPPKLSEKTKESKLLVRSFQHIYKIAGLGIAAGFSGLLSLSSLRQEKQLPVYNEITEKQLPSTKKSNEDFEMSDSTSSDMASSDELIRSSPVMSSESESSFRVNEITESEEYIQQSSDTVEIVNGVDTVVSASPDLFIPFAIATVILGGLTLYYLWKFLRKSSA